MPRSKFMQIFKVEILTNFFFYALFLPPFSRLNVHLYAARLESDGFCSNYVRPRASILVKVLYYLTFFCFCVILYYNKEFFTATECEEYYVKHQRRGKGGRGIRIHRIQYLE